MEITLHRPIGSMAAIGALVLSGYSHFRLLETASSSRMCRSRKLPCLAKQKSKTTVRASSLGENSISRLTKKEEEEDEGRRLFDYTNPDPEPEPRKKLKDFIEECRELIRSDGGPPRWFSPLECGSRASSSPLLLYLPGIDGTGLGLITQHYNLGKIFDIWCLHTPVKDRTSYMGLVKIVEKTVRSERNRLPKRPIYLVGDSLGGCIALDVAARNPNIDLVLILANPATSFGRSQLQPLIPLLEVLPDHLVYTLTSVIGGPVRFAVDNMVNGLPLPQTVGELPEDLVVMPTYLSVLADILPRETLLWKLHMQKSASQSANSNIHAVQAESLILCSRWDQLLPSVEEGQRLQKVMSKCEIRKFEGSGHFLFLEDDVDLVTVLKGAGFYRRGKYYDPVSDFLPPTPLEFRKINDSNRFMFSATSPVMFSTLKDGKVLRGFDGIPSEGPVMLVGNHSLLGFDINAMVFQILLQRNILVRGIAHPFFFDKFKDIKFFELSTFDYYKVMGCAPVSGYNFYRLLSQKSHILLYPGGVRESFHRKGEEYKLFWPEQPEFVRAAARFGAKIVPFGVVGEDDIGQVVFDYDDYMRIPYLKSEIKKFTAKGSKLRNRNDASGEVANQDWHIPVILPKIPGRCYYYFGKPIETNGRKQELRDNEKCRELYLQVKCEVEKCISYLKEKREEDPYRSIFPRLLYQAQHGFDSDIPSFEP